MDDKIKVIWVDDDINEFESLIEKAFTEYDIDITPFEYWTKAAEELKNNASAYTAIILDANCKFDEKSDPDIDDFLGNVFPKLTVSLPYFIYTAQGESGFLRKQRANKTDPDYTWKIENNRCFYLKNKDDEALFKNIRDYGKNSHQYRIKNLIYRSVFEAIERLSLNSEVAENLTDLLLPIHFGEHTEKHYDEHVKEYNEKAIYFRKCLEHIFRSMFDNGLLPMGCLNNNTGGRVNISGSFYFFIKYFASKLISGLADGVKLSASMMLHTSKKEGDNFYSYSKQLRSPYLLQSHSLWLCDFILWYDKHTKEHDKEWNRSQWQGREDANWEGSKGELRWNIYHNIWTIDSKIFLDKEEPGFNNRKAYNDGQKCLYIAKKVGPKIYAIGVDIIED